MTAGHGPEGKGRPARPRAARPQGLPCGPAALGYKGQTHGQLNRKRGGEGVRQEQAGPRQRDQEGPDQRLRPGCVSAGWIKVARTSPGFRPMVAAWALRRLRDEGAASRAVPGEGLVVTKAALSTTYLKKVFRYPGSEIRRTRNELSHLFGRPAPNLCSRPSRVRRYLPGRGCVQLGRDTRIGESPSGAQPRPGGPAGARRPTSELRREGWPRGTRRYGGCDRFLGVVKPSNCSSGSCCAR